MSWTDAPGKDVCCQTHLHESSSKKLCFI